MIEGITSYGLLIFIALVIIISYLFNIVSKKLRIPSVLLLIFSGIIFNEAITSRNLPAADFDIMPLLQILGVLGLIMIVLEAALDLKLEKSKKSLITRSFSIATLLLIFTSLVTAFIINMSFEIEGGFGVSLLYAIPLSIMSSAIIIPSVEHLEEHKREFMVYESTFSDIMGIIFFYFMIDLLSSEHSATSVVFSSALNIVLTIVIAVVVTYGIVYAFHKVLSHINYFLVFALLILFYAVGKQFHLSSLIIILVFGLIVNNKDIFFVGKFKNVIDRATHINIVKNLKVFTEQTAFLVRTFFFFFFGMTITTSSLLNLEMYQITGLLLLTLYIIRFINLNVFLKYKVMPKLFIAPRGLITVLLFFSIPKDLLRETFEKDIVFLLIIATNLIMMAALMLYKGEIKDIEYRNEK